jgi:DNA-dependent RNA polymerase
MIVKNTYGKVPTVYDKTIYKDSLYIRIKNILGDPKKFIKNNKSRRDALNSQLTDLCTLANHTSLFSASYFKHKSLTKEYKSFRNLFENAFNNGNTRSNSGDMSRKFDDVIKGVCSCLKNKGYIDDCSIHLRVRSKIIGDQVFNICILSATSLIKYNHKDIDQECNEILHVKFIRNLSKNLIIYISSLILENNMEVVTGVRFIIDNVKNIIQNITSITDLSHQLSEIFQHCAVEKVRTIRFKDSINSYKVLEISQKLMSEYIIPTHMPRIVEPDNTYDNIEDHFNLSKPIKNGISKVTISTATRDALIISQRKKFKINQQAIDLFKALDELPHKSVKHIDSLPFTPISSLRYMAQEIEDMSSSIIESVSESIKSIIYSIKSKKKDYDRGKIDIATHISNVINVDIDSVKIHMSYYNKKKKYKELMRLRSLHNTTIKLAELFIGFPIYFSNTYDYRLRMYPYSYFFSRTTGIYKYLMTEFDSTIITPEGYISMVKAYVNNFNDKYEYLGDISIERIEYIKECFKPLDLKDLLNKSSYFYYALLGDEIYKLKISNKTNFMLEIDQKSSSCVFMSILLGDRELASTCNLISKDLSAKMSDPALILMNECYNFYYKDISTDSMCMLSSKRDIHKYLLMCFCYNQTRYGRSNELRKFITLDSDVRYISKTYPIFIDTVFNKISMKKDMINNIARYYLNNSEEGFIINTLDGSRISWSNYANTNKTLKKKFKSVITGAWVSYSVVPYDTGKHDINKSVTGLLPSFIHSMDGAIMRMIIRMIYYKHGYIINHLHDSIQFHPNQYHNILESISEVYTTNDLGSSLRRCLLNNLSNVLIKEKKIVFDKMVEQFEKSDYEKLEILKEKFNPANMYPFE